MVAAVASFIIYASTVVALQQYRETFSYVERVGLAAAVSNVVYQAPFGKVYPAVETQLLDLRASAGSVLDKVKQLGSPSGDPVTAINDGNGVGFVVFSLPSSCLG